MGTKTKARALPEGARPGDTYDGYYWRDEHGRTLTTCYGEGREWFICGAPVPGGTYCGADRGSCREHARRN